MGETSKIGGSLGGLSTKIHAIVDLNIDGGWNSILESMILLIV